MRFASVFVLSFVAGVLGVPLASEMSKVKRQQPLNGGAFYCTNANFTGVCAGTRQITDACNNLDDTLNDQVSSFRPVAPDGVFSEPSQIVCLLWSERDCTGTNPGGWIQNPVDDLSTINFDNIASSFQCKNA